MDFLEETIECLNKNGKTENDVMWVGRGFNDYNHYTPYKTTWEDFKSKADFRYDNGFGSNEIPMDLIVVGKDFWLERHEYDGAEWWEYKALPTEPAEVRELTLEYAY